MAKKFDDTVLDAALNIVKGATSLVFCSAEPANYAGIAAVALVTKTGLVAGSYTGPANGDVSGRKLTVNATAGNIPSANGTVIYAVLHNGTVILAGTTVTSQAVTTAQTWDTPAFDIELADPA